MRSHRSSASGMSASRERSSAIVASSFSSVIIITWIPAYSRALSAIVETYRVGATKLIGGRSFVEVAGGRTASQYFRTGVGLESTLSRQVPGLLKVWLT